jgi:hypothetical protein
MTQFTDFDINVGSMMSLFGASFAPAYGASKGAWCR